MAEGQITPPPPINLDDVTPPVIPVDPETARATARFTLVSPGGSLTGAFEALRSAQTACTGWSDEFWAASGYDKEATTAALDSLVTAGNTFETEQSDNIKALGAQTRG